MSFTFRFYTFTDSNPIEGREADYEVEAENENEAVLRYLLFHQPAIEQQALQAFSPVPEELADDSTITQDAVYSDMFTLVEASDELVGGLAIFTG